jgi:hypothetical protein
VHNCKRIVIPGRARKATLQVLDRPHTGVAKTVEAAKQLYFSPKMNNHIKDMVHACERCQFYKSSKQKQEQIQQTPFKDLYPMAEVGADLFKAGFISVSLTGEVFVLNLYVPCAFPAAPPRAAPGLHPAHTDAQLSPLSLFFLLLHPHEQQQQPHKDLEKRRAFKCRFLLCSLVLKHCNSSCTRLAVLLIWNFLLRH